MSAGKQRSIRNRKVHAVERATVLGKPAIDPLDEEPMEPRPDLSPIPWNQASLSEEGRSAVEAALLAGYPRNQIARALGTTVATLRRLVRQDARLSDAVDARKDLEESELRDLLLRMARKGDTVAAIFLAKAQFGWRDRDDGKAKPSDTIPGVLVLPAAGKIEEWEAAAYRQQAKFRERLDEGAGPRHP